MSGIAIRPKWQFSTLQLASLFAVMAMFGANLSRCAYTGDWSSANAAMLIATGAAAWFLISRCRSPREEKKSATL